MTEKEVLMKYNEDISGIKLPPISQKVRQAMRDSREKTEQEHDAEGVCALPVKEERKTIWVFEKIGKNSVVVFSEAAAIMFLVIAASYIVFYIINSVEVGSKPMDAPVSEISTVDESEKEYAETILAQVNERKSKNDNNYDGIIIKGIHGRDFFEVLDFRHNDLYLHYSNPILEKLTDYEYISNGRRVASFNQQPSPEELELIWKCADASLSESEFEEYRNQLIDLISKPTSSFFKYFTDDDLYVQYICDACQEKNIVNQWIILWMKIQIKLAWKNC